MALPSPSPFSLPLLSLTYITRQQRGIHASRAEFRLGAHAVRPTSFGRGPPKNTYGGLLHTPRPKYTVGHPPLPIPQHHLFSGAQNQIMGNWPLRGPHGGCFLHHPIFGPWESDPKSKIIGWVQFWETPFWAPRGHLPYFAVLDS